MQTPLAKLLIGIGVALIAIGLIVYFWGDKLKWIGNLPGDIRFEGENYKFYFPITTMILFSVLLNIIYRLLK
ncbi:MAG TPA: DUF2905 domain-containing protein [Saprospiraceae bacterium]|nr:DUF2905 domain-containing protein [Saprospiraceae bacterium]HPK09353.1 DUF2905 domain-containing protein [Saprospiraceae bacterium]HRX28363.1 DUF2905 domain-containing protein [Saprospiraceae bacterium]